LKISQQAQGSDMAYFRHFAFWTWIVACDRPEPLWIPFSTSLTIHRVIETFNRENVSQQRKTSRNTKGILRRKDRKSSLEGNYAPNRVVYGSKVGSWGPLQATEARAWGSKSGAKNIEGSLFQISFWLKVESFQLIKRSRNPRRIAACLPKHLE
jgi:hypothetical protein